MILFNLYNYLRMKKILIVVSNTNLLKRDIYCFKKFDQITFFSKIFIFFAFVSAFSEISAQGVDCSSADPFCTNSSYTFPASTDVPSLGEVGCLYTTPNPAWYWMQIANSGDLNIHISSGGDVDFICWGPFNTLSDACASNLMSNTGVDCSYSTAAEEDCYIPNAVTGQVYVLLITNFANITTNISFNQTSGTGTTNCGIIAPPITNNGPLCIGDTLNLIVTNPTAGATYSWIGPNGWSSNIMDPSIPNVTQSQSGTYSLTITVNGETSPAVTTTVVVNQLPDISITSSESSICIGSSSILTAQGGQFYTWNTTESGNTITVTPAHNTTYTVTVTAADGCSSTGDITINVITPPNSDAGPDASVCSHNYTMQAVSSIGNGTWTYTGPGTATFNNVNSAVSPVSVSTDGQYTFVWSENNNGCVSSDTTLITFTTMPTPNAGNDITECQLSSTLHAIPSFGTGTWTQISGPGTISFTDVNNSNTSISTITQGAYSLQWTEDNGNGCIQHDLVNVTLWQPPSANAGVLDSTCSLSYQMQATPSVGVGTWTQVSGPGATQFSGNHSPTASATASVHGSYNYAWTENNNGCISSDTVNIIFNYIPTSTFTISEINCFSDTATLNFTGLVDAYVTYNWNFGSANIINGSQGGPYSINYSNAGTFPVTLTVSQHGCVSNLTTVQVTNPPLLQLSLQKQDITCFGAMNGKVFTTVSGGTPPYNYHWSNGVPYSFITNAIAGNYAVTVTDNKGCKQNDITSIYEPSKLFIDIPDSIPLCNDSSVTITASITGGIFPYTLFWSTGQTQQTITVSPQISTYYFVTVSDANQCQTSDNLLVYVYPPLHLSYTTSNDSICPGEEFSIYPVVSGGNGGPYQFYLNMQPITLPIHLYPNMSQEYQLQVRDGCNYVVTENVPIFVYPSPPINPSSNIINGCEPLTVIFNDGSPDSGQTYIWAFGDGESAYIKNPTHTFNNDGVYTITLTVTNIFGCKVENVYPNWITVYPQPTARFELDPLHASIIKPIVNFLNYSSLTDSVMWYFGDGDSTAIYQPTHIYKAAPDMYHVMLVVYTNKGCADTTWGTVIVDNVFTFYAPTAFSPNADGYNDEFRVFGNGIEDGSFSLQIYDRWGEVIWESTDINKGWDGKVKGGKVAQIGSYNWLAKFRDENNVLHEETGPVTVIR
jgi:gliding motility-associated-like protein